MSEPKISTNVKVAIVMGSDSDWPVMGEAAKALAQFDIDFDVQVLSAHRTPERMMEWAKSAVSEGFSVIIAGAGGAAHLPGMIASLTPLPVIGVPVPLSKLDGLDSLLSIVQMPSGVPVATVSIGGAWNAGVLAAQILGASHPHICQLLEAYKSDLISTVTAKNEALRDTVAQDFQSDSR